jgi:hypothetical protein
VITSDIRSEELPRSAYFVVRTGQSGFERRENDQVGVQAVQNKPYENNEAHDLHHELTLSGQFRAIRCSQLLLVEINWIPGTIATDLNSKRTHPKTHFLKTGIVETHITPCKSYTLVVRIAPKAVQNLPVTNRLNLDNRRERIVNHIVAKNETKSPVIIKAGQTRTSLQQFGIRNSRALLKANDAVELRGDHTVLFVARQGCILIHKSSTTTSLPTAKTK